MKLFKFGTRLVFFTLLFNIIYSIYYGWNAEPINETEAMLDKLCRYAFNIGIVCVLIPGIDLYRYSIERYEKIKNRKKEREKDQAVPWHKYDESGEHPRQGHTEE